MLRRWLGGLADRIAGPDEKPLRILLLERHSAPDAGWWAELCQPGTLTGRGPDALIDPGAPLLLAPLRAVVARLPQAFAGLMAAIVRGYLRRCEQADAEPNQALLAPVRATFARLQAPPAPPADPPPPGQPA